MATQLDFPELAAKMKGINTTEDYDLLVSYSEKKINQLLQERSEQLKSLVELKLKAVYTDLITNKKVDVDVCMKLDHPLLQFKDQHGNIALTFGVQEAKLSTQGQEITLPSGVVLKFKTILASATGTVESSRSQNGFAGNTKTASANEPVPINPGEKDVSQGVCISFRDASIEWFGTTDESKEALQGKSFILESIQDHFKKNAELKYFIAGVSNEYVAESGSHPLRPRSFCFSTLKGKTEDHESALCMWISVKEGTNRGRSSNPDFTGLFYEKGLIPIPRGRTCSLIMKKDLLVKQFILSSLSNGFDNITPITISGDFSFGGNMRASDVEVPEVYWRYSLKVAAIKFSPSSPKTQITFDTGINSVSNEMKYISDLQHVRWDTWEDHGEFVHHHHGTTNLGFQWTAKGSWTDRNTAQNPNLISFAWTSNDWDITKSAEDQGWWERLGGGQTWIPTHLKNLAIPKPDVNLEMKSLDYFLTTNLLYPGKHIFKADSPSPGSTDKGIALPHDFILTGEVQTD